MNRDQITDVIYSSIEELNFQIPKEHHVQKLLNQEIIGLTDVFDSLRLLTFFSLIEERIEEGFGKQIQIANNPELDFQKHFKDVESLTQYILTLTGH